MVKKLISIIFILLIVVFAGACPSPDTTTTTTTTTTSTQNSLYEILVRDGYAHPEIPRITCEELKQLMDNGGNDFVLIDTRAESVFNSGHLPGAINIVYDISSAAAIEALGQILSTLPDDTLKIIYCDCSLDQESAGMAQRLIEKGYKVENIKVLWKGIFYWQELGYPVTTQ